MDFEDIPKEAFPYMHRKCLVFFTRYVNTLAIPADYDEEKASSSQISASPLKQTSGKHYDDLRVRPYAKVTFPLNLILFDANIISCV